MKLTNQQIDALANKVVQIRMNEFQKKKKNEEDKIRKTAKFKAIVAEVKKIHQLEDKVRKALGMQPLSSTYRGNSPVPINEIGVINQLLSKVKFGKPTSFNTIRDEIILASVEAETLAELGKKFGCKL